MACFERPEHTVRSVRAAINAGLSAEQVIVVDGGSSAATLERLRTEKLGFALVPAGRNLWWAQAMNVGLEVALERGTPLILMLNQDCRVERDAVANLIAAERQYPAVGVFACAVLAEEDQEMVIDAGHLWRRHHRFPGVWSFEPTVKRGRSSVGVPDKPYPTDAFTGRGVLIRAEVLRRVGLFDTKAFPQRGGDDDLSLRCKKAGVASLVVPSARVFTGWDDCSAERTRAGIFRQVWWMLFDEVGGAGVRVHFRFVLRHCPVAAMLPTYCYRIANLVRAACSRVRRSGSLEATS